MMSPGALAAALARAILLLSPRAFRRDVGEAVVLDIRLQADNLASSRGAWAAWRRLPAIVASLIANVAGEWRDRLAATGRPTFGVPISPLDFKLGLRMMARHPGLTLIGILGMTVAIALGAVFASAVGIVYAELPFRAGDRVVAIENWDLTINNQEYQNLHDYLMWRDELETVEDLGAYHTVRRNLIGQDGHTETVLVAETTAAAFRIPGVPPRLGRTLIEEDMSLGADQVLVIGYDVWRTRFAADPGIIGRDLRLGATTHTVVGVMPEGFAFPLAHELWTPFHLDPTAYSRREGPEIDIFGRLAAGETVATAQAELTAIGQRSSTAFPETHQQIRPAVIRYTALPFDDMEGVEIPLVATLIVLLLVVVSVNVGTLIYARTATRRSELLVRTALGASRSRLVAQLFVEALVVAATAAALGLAITAAVLDRLNVLIGEFAGRSAPFWMEFTLSPATIVWALALAVLGAVITGVLPALAATGRKVHAGMQGFSGGAGGGMGRTWTGLIVAQVAFAVAVLPTTVFVAWEMTRFGTADPGFAAEQFVAGYLNVDPGFRDRAAAGGDSDVAGVAVEQVDGDTTTAGIAFATQYANLKGELARRLQAELGASGIGFASPLPSHEPAVRIEIEGDVPASRIEEGDASTSTAATSRWTRTIRAEPGFFDALEIAQLEGRRLAPVDAAAEAGAVLVNRSFVAQVLGGASATGRRIRYVGGYRAGGVERMPEGTDTERWHEIVGVVEDFPPRPTEPGRTEARVYHAVAPGQAYPAGLVVRMPADIPADLIQQTRNVAAAVDPALRFTRLATLDSMMRELQAGQRLASLSLVLITLSVALLSMAGLYALMSFAVVRRRREIGIRSALGGQPRRILASIFSRVFTQVGLGAALGLALAFPLNSAIGQEMGNPQGAAFLLAVPALMMLAGLLAALVPARRGLRIEPTEALRE